MTNQKGFIQSLYEFWAKIPMLGCFSFEPSVCFFLDILLFLLSCLFFSLVLQLLLLTTEKVQRDIQFQQKHIWHCLRLSSCATHRRIGRVDCGTLCTFSLTDLFAFYYDIALCKTLAHFPVLFALSSRNTNVLIEWLDDGVVWVVDVPVLI